jgi:hypothetical protein
MKIKNYKEFNEGIFDFFKKESDDDKIVLNLIKNIDKITILDPRIYGEFGYIRYDDEKLFLSEKSLTISKTGDVIYSKHCRKLHKMLLKKYEDEQKIEIEEKLNKKKLEEDNLFNNFKKDNNLYDFVVNFFKIGDKHKKPGKINRKYNKDGDVFTSTEDINYNFSEYSFVKYNKKTGEIEIRYSYPVSNNYKVYKGKVDDSDKPKIDNFLTEFFENLESEKNKEKLFIKDKLRK